MSETTAPRPGWAYMICTFCGGRASDHPVSLPLPTVPVRCKGCAARQHAAACCTCGFHLPTAADAAWTVEVTPGEFASQCHTCHRAAGSPPIPNCTRALPCGQCETCLPEDFAEDRDGERHPDGIYPGDRVRITSTGDFGTLCMFLAVVIRDNTEVSIRVPATDITRVGALRALAFVPDVDQADDPDPDEDPYEPTNVAVCNWLRDEVEARGITLGGSERLADLNAGLYSGAPRVWTFSDTYRFCRAMGMTRAEMAAGLDSAFAEADR